MICGAKVFNVRTGNPIFQLHFSCWFNCLVSVEHKNNTLHRQACLCNTEVWTCHARVSNICRSCDLRGALTVAPNLLVLLEFCPPWPGVSRELSEWWTAAQTGSSPSPVLALWHRPTTDPDRPGRRRGSHLQRETKRSACSAVCRWTLWSAWELTASVCDLSHRQAPDGRRGQERVCAAVGQGKRPVMDSLPSQHQDIVEQEQAHVTDLLVGPDGFRFCWVTQLGDKPTPSSSRCVLVTWVSPEAARHDFWAKQHLGTRSAACFLPSGSTHTHEWMLTCTRIISHALGGKSGSCVFTGQLWIIFCVSSIRVSRSEFFFSCEQGRS